METSLDIVKLVEDNPLTKFNGKYQSKLVQKLQSKFNTEEQNIFLASFYCYLNCKDEDFVIDLRKVWKWLDFNRFNDAKRLLINHFTSEIDYKLLLCSSAKQNGSGGHNRQDFLLTVKCFKKLCLKARTEKADQIHDYYIRLEEITHEIVKEESEILRNQLTQNLITNFQNKPIFYLGYAEPEVLKFGYTDNIERRMKDHQKEIKSDFKFELIYESLYNREIERKLKLHTNIISKRLARVYNNKKQTELIQLDDNFTIHSVDKIVKEIKQELENQNVIKDLRRENAELKIQMEDPVKTKVIDLQQDSMQNLDIRIREIKRAVCFNFLVDFVAKQIKEENKIVKLTVDEIYILYVRFREANRYTDPIHNEQYEKSWITRVFKEINGIKNTTKNSNIRAKEFHIDIISKWICENINIPRRFRNTFRKIENIEQKYEIIKYPCNDELRIIYSFLNVLIEDNSEQITIRKTIINSTFQKFLLQNKCKKITMSYLYQELIKLPGISLVQRMKDENVKCAKGIKFQIPLIKKWFENEMSLDKEFLPEKLPKGIQLRNGKYMVRATINGKRRSLGTFNGLNDAIKKLA